MQKMEEIDNCGKLIEKPEECASQSLVLEVRLRIRRLQAFVGAQHAVPLLMPRTTVEETSWQRYRDSNPDFSLERATS